MEIGLGAFLGRCEERELGYAKYLAIDVFDVLLPLYTNVSPLSSDRVTSTVRDALDQHTRPPVSSSHNLMFNNLFAALSASLSVSFLSTPVKARMPFPIEAMSSPSTVTDADFTRCATTLKSN